MKEVSKVIRKRLNEEDSGINILFSDIDSEEKIDYIKSLSDSELIDINSSTIETIVRKLGSSFYFPRMNKPGNGWNSEIAGFEIRKDGCYVLIETDEDSDFKYVDVYDFMNQRGFETMVNFNKVEYSANHIAKTIRCLLIEFVYNY